MSLLSYKERQQHWEWCREYLDREGFYRVDAKHPPIPGKAGGQYHWQGYLRRATYNPEFAHRLGLLFWDHFKPVFECQPFQLCACAPSGPPIGMIVSTSARRLGIPINVFVARRTPKEFGVDNWFDGIIKPELSVMLVDDVAASTNHMRLASARIKLKLKLSLHRNYFTITNKVGGRFNKNAQHTENYLDNELISLFTMNNFCLHAQEFKERYGCEQKWTGLIR